MSRDPDRAATQFFGGRVCLDFANTLDWRTSDQPQELIPNYGALVAWSTRRWTLPPRALANLRSRATSHPLEAEAVLADAFALRAELWKIADALRRQRAIDLVRVNRMLLSLPPQPRLVKHENTFVH